MSENLTLWQSVEKTPPEHAKPITGKSYSGNSPRPHFLVRKATEMFGPCGIGWGFTITERVENGATYKDGTVERMHIAHVTVWYEWQGKRGEVSHVGGTPFSGKRKNGEGAPFTDEDAPKKSVTDALVKALSLIGFAGDIFMGRYDDSKYMAELREEFGKQKLAGVEPAPAPAPKGRQPSPNSASTLKREAVWAEMEDDIAQCGSTVSLASVYKKWAAKANEDGWPSAWIAPFEDTFTTAKNELQKMADREAEEAGDSFLGDAPPATNGKAYAQQSGRA